MRSLALAALIAVVASTASAAEYNSKFEAYKQRRAEKKAIALELRRERNALRGPHVYLPYHFHLRPTPFLSYEEFHVRQPIPIVRPVVGLPVASYHRYY